MKIFKRILYFVIFLAMAAGFFSGCTATPFPHERYRHAFFFLEWIGAPLSMLVWCLLCLKSEPDLAQVGLLIVIFDVIVSIQVVMPD